MRQPAARIEPVALVYGRAEHHRDGARDGARDGEKGARIIGQFDAIDGWLEACVARADGLYGLRRRVEQRAHDGAKPVLLSSQSFSRSADGTTGRAKGLSGGRSPGSVREVEAPRAKPLEEVARYGSPQVMRPRQQQPKTAPASADEGAAGAAVGAASAAPYPVVARQRDDAKDNTPRAKGKAKEGNGLVAQPPSSVELAAYRKMIQSSVGKDGAPRLDSVSLYSLGKLLGKGAFGAVKMGVHKLTGAVVAIKNFKKADVKNEVEARAIDREIRILKQSVHQHIIKLYEVIDSPTNWYLVMECAANGDLAGHLEKKGDDH